MRKFLATVLRISRTRFGGADAGGVSALALDAAGERLPAGEEARRGGIDERRQFVGQAKSLSVIESRLSRRARPTGRERLRFWEASVVTPTKFEPAEVLRAEGKQRRKPS